MEMYFVPRGKVIFFFMLPLEFTTGNPLIPRAEMGKTTTSESPWKVNVREVSLLVARGSWITKGAVPEVALEALVKGETCKDH